MLQVQPPPAYTNTLLQPIKQPVRCAPTSTKQMHALTIPSPNPELQTPLSNQHVSTTPAIIHCYCQDKLTTLTYLSTSHISHQWHHIAIPIFKLPSPITFPSPEHFYSNYSPSLISYNTPTPKTTSLNHENPNPRINQSIAWYGPASYASFSNLHPKSTFEHLNPIDHLVLVFLIL